MAARKKEQEPTEVEQTPAPASGPVEAVALSQIGSTFKERAAASKAVQRAENKAVKGDSTK